MGEAGRTVDVLSLLFMALRIFVWIVKAMLYLAWYSLLFMVKVLPSVIKGTIVLIGVAYVLLKVVFALVATLIGGVAEGIERKHRQKLAGTSLSRAAVTEAGSPSPLSSDSGSIPSQSLDVSLSRRQSASQNSSLPVISISSVAVGGDQDRMTFKSPELAVELLSDDPGPAMTHDEQGDPKAPASSVPRHPEPSAALDATQSHLHYKTDALRDAHDLPNSFAPRAQTLGWISLGIAIVASTMLILGVSDHALIALLGLDVLLVAPASGVLAILAIVFGGIGLRRRRLQDRRSSAKSGLALGIVAFCLPILAFIVSGAISVALAR